MPTHGAEGVPRGVDPVGGSTATFRRGSRASSRESESDTEFLSEFVSDPAPDPPDSDSEPECEVSAHPGGANVSTCCGFGAHPGSSSICARTSASASVSPLGRGSAPPSGSTSGPSRTRRRRPALRHPPVAPPCPPRTSSPRTRPSSGSRDRAETRRRRRRTPPGSSAATRPNRGILSRFYRTRRRRRRRPRRTRGASACPCPICAPRTDPCACNGSRPGTCPAPVLGRRRRLWSFRRRRLRLSPLLLSRVSPLRPLLLPARFSRAPRVARTRAAARATAARGRGRRGCPSARRPRRRVGCGRARGAGAYARVRRDDATRLAGKGGGAGSRRASGAP